MENDIEIPDLEETGDNLSPDDDVEKRLQTEVVRKKHWREKFEKLNEAHQKLQQEIDKSTQEKPAEPRDDMEARMETKFDLRQKGYTREEISYFEAFAKGSGKPLADVVNDLVVIGGIESMRKQKSVEQATPAPSNRSPQSTAKTWAEMTNEERKANFGSFMQKGRISNE